MAVAFGPPWSNRKVCVAVDDAALGVMVKVRPNFGSVANANGCAPAGVAKAASDARLVP